jgi:hypothetical protein
MGPYGQSVRSSVLPMRQLKQPFIEETLEIWQRRTPKALNLEDARQITENVTGFFKVLLEWEVAEHHSADQFAKNRVRTDFHAGGRRPG